MSVPATVLFVESGTHGGGSFMSLHALLRNLDRERFCPVAAYLNRTRFVDLAREQGAEVHVLTDLAYSRSGVPGWLRRKAESKVEHAYERSPGRAEAWLKLVHGPLVRSLCRLVRDSGAGLLFCNNQIHRDVFGVLAARRLGLPLVSFLRSPHGDGFTPAKAALCNAWVSAYIANSGETWRYWTEKGVDPAKTAIVRNGIPDFQAEPLDLAAEFGVPPGRFLVGCVSRLLAIKGQDFLVRSFAGLLRSGVDAHLVLVGDGEARQELEALVRGLDLGSRVTFTGQEPRAREIMARFDVLVQPSRFDSFGRTIGEAMRLSIPVVATDAGGIREIVEHGADGMLVQYGDQEGLSRILADLARDRESGRRLALAARGKVRAMLDPAVQTGKIQDIMDQALAMGPGPYRASGAQ